jgi:phosphatidylethanolamine/phosphatidyl-N-methylethanolamine N-methyltransferase
MSISNPQATMTARARYDRLAPWYDRIGRANERTFAPWRAALWQRVRGPRVLEVGVGTGKNIAYYPPGRQVTAVDFAPRMLAQAEAEARRLGSSVELREADVQALPFPAASFETVLATFVFCSVPDPLLGLRELHRVLVPGGQLLLLEHVLSHQPLLRPLMQLLNPLVVRLMGANINRETVETVRRAVFVDLQVETLWADIVKRIEAKSAQQQGTNAEQASGVTGYQMTWFPL